jgi:ACS family glucarate transporter-like MFS transporter
MIRYAVGASGLFLCTQMVHAESALVIALCFSVAMIGVEFTLSPSWAFCMDIGGGRSGAVSGSMNMVGSLGAARDRITGCAER